jgi:translation initiation factor 2 subunit 3
MSTTLANDSKKLKGDVDPTPKIIEINYSKLIERQPTINIGTIGSVSHGKTTVVRQISGVRTQRYQEEIDSNRTIYLGYGNAKIYICPKTGYTVVQGSNDPVPLHPTTGKELICYRHISFVDCPGHKAYMATMISGTAIMDYALLLIAANQEVPQKQTVEHLAAIKNTPVKDIVILQNKLDLVTKDEALANLKQIQTFIAGSPAENSKIIPISAQFGSNIHEIYSYIINNMVQPERDYNLDPIMCIVRSFKNNHPDTTYDKLQGGVVGGSIIQGTFAVGDYVELRPGFVVKNGAKTICYPLLSKIESLYSEKTSLDIAVPGGLIGVGLQLDGSFTQGGTLIGQMIGHVGKLPSVYCLIKIEYTREGSTNSLHKPKPNEKILVAINSKIQGGTIVSREKNEHIMEILLDDPVCLDPSTNVVILRKVVELNQYCITYKGKLTSDCKPHSDVLPTDMALYQKLIQINQKRIIKIIDDLPKISNMKPSESDYINQLSNIKLKDGQSNQNLRLPSIHSVKRDRKTYFSNFADCCRQFDIQVESFLQGASTSMVQFASEINDVVNIQQHLLQYLKKELTNDISIDATHQLIIDGSYGKTEITNVVKRYCQLNKKCFNCGSMMTRLGKRNRRDTIYCMNCRSVITVPV